MLEMKDVELGNPPVWNRDPITGITAPMILGKRIDYRNRARVGNIKYLWEPNRHAELMGLAQAHHLTGDARFSDGFRQLMVSWIAQCPAGLGPNWTSALEASIRLINWSISWQLLGGDSASVFAGTSGASFRETWLNSVRQHCQFVSRYLSRYSSANNHLIGELAGLFVASVTWPFFPESIRWQTFAKRELEEQSRIQTFSDGVNREQAIWYHHEVLDFFLLCDLIARSIGVDFSSSYRARTEQMLEYIASIMDVGGHVPAIGDADDARILRMSVATSLDVFRSLLATGAVLFNRQDFQKKAGTFDEKTRWLLGDHAEVSFDAVGKAGRGALPRRSFPDGGYYVLGSDLEQTNEVRLVADCGNLGFLSIAAHGHADALSFTLFWCGEPWLIDPGTFSYSTNDPAREYFKGTSAHNTVVVDSCSQSVSGGTFLWLRHARAGVDRFESTDECDRLTGWHDGYRRLRDPVKVRRSWTYRKQERYLQIDDEFSCKGDHSLDFFWHFAPDCAVRLESGGLVAFKNGRSLELGWNEQLRARVYRGSMNPMLGWYSRKLGEKVPTSTLVLSGRIAGPRSFTSHLSFNGSRKP